MNKEEVRKLADENSQWILFDLIKPYVYGIILLEKYKWYEFKKKRLRENFKINISKVIPKNVTIEYFIPEKPAWTKRKIHNNYFGAK